MNNYIPQKPMKGRILKIQFVDKQAFLTNDSPLSLEQLGLEGMEKYFINPSYWEVLVRDYIPHENRILADVLTYNLGMTLLNNDLSYEIKRISFINSINTHRLVRNISSPRKLPSEGMQTNKDAEPGEMQEEVSPGKEETNRKTLAEVFFVPLKKVRFKTGGVSFEKKFRNHPRTFELEIQNYDIREEFDAIKNYFANILGTKKIEVNAVVDLVDDQVVDIKVRSREIARIDKDIVENVKFEYVNNNILKKKILADVDKNLFTMDEYFDAFQEKVKSKAFYQNDKELFEDILKISNTKHYKHLRLLSSRHAHQIMKLRFVHKPISFLFLIEGVKNFHVIWETLDTKEATYIWHIPKELDVLKQTIRKIEDIINVIKVQGKTAYINTHDDPFRRIYHDYSDLVEGFVKWKGEVESVLT